MKKNLIVILSLLLFAMGANATNFYVDGSKADDSGNGQSWATAKKTITAAHGLGVVGDNVFVKAGTYSFSGAFWSNDRNFYGGFAGTEALPTERPTSDLDANGITEPWEFTNQTILNFTLTNSTGLAFNARAAARNFDGFKITGTQTASTTGTTTTYVFGPNMISTVTNVVFQNNIVSDITVANTLTLAYTQGSIMQIFGNNVKVNNCLFEKNTVTLTGAASQLDYQQVPIIYLKASSATARNVMQNCIVRNNQVTIDYSATALTGVNNSRGLIIAIDCHATYPTTLKNTIVHNNDMTFIPKTGASNSLGNAGAVTNYAAANSQSDSIINCTIAKNKGTKTGCAGLKIGIQYNNFQYPYVKIFNNVCYDNAVDGSIGTMGNLTLSSGTSTLLAGGIQIANNYANGGATQIVTNGSIVYGNVSDLSNTNTEATKGAKFVSPSTVIGYSSNASVATSRWSLAPSSYLIGKGIATSSVETDKAGHRFAISPSVRSVGAYELCSYQSNASGNWNNTAAWQTTNNNSTWFASTDYPNGTASTVSVANGHLIAVSANVVTNALAINAGGKLTLNNGNSLSVASLDIQSDATNGTGTFTDSNPAGGLTVTGTTTVNQSLQHSGALRSWYLTPPVASAAPSGMDVIKSYDEATYNWSAHTPTMVAKTGYIVNPTAAENNIAFTGALNNNDQDITLTSRTGIANKAGFNLIGNPYPSFLDWKQVCDYTADAGSTYPNQLAMRSTTMWYRTKAGSYTFYTVNGTSGEGSPVEASRNIPPMQAFWVRAVVGGGTLALKNTMRLHESTSNLLKAPGLRKAANPLVRLQVSNGTNTDEAVLHISNNAANELDAYDSPKMSNDNAAVPEIYTTVGSEKVVINGMNSIPMDQPLGLGFVAGNATSFSIKANEVTGLPSDVKLILKDNVTLKETDLTDGVSVYGFTPAVTNADRFSIIFRSPGAVTGLESSQKERVIVYGNAAKQLTILCNVALTQGSMVSIYNAVGQKLLTAPTTGASTLIQQSFSAGVYFVTVTGAGSKLTQKVVIN